MNWEKGRETVLCKQLEELGYDQYANLIKTYIPSNHGAEKRIAIVGENLSGKSTLINKLIGENVIPTGIIPIEAKIVLRFGDEKKAVNQFGEVLDIAQLNTLIGDLDYVEIQTKSDVFDEKMEFIEIPNLISKKNDDFERMSELYNSDAVIMVMSAERLLNESERQFIKNYINYVGSKRLLIAVSKFDILPESEAMRVMDYLGKQRAILFPDVACMVLGQSNQSGFFSEISEAAAWVRQWEESEKSTEQLLDHVAKYILKLLKKDREQIKEDLRKNEEERKRERQVQKDKKAMDELEAEKAMLEYQMRRNAASEKIDLFLKDKFKETEALIMREMKESSDYVSWYKNRLSACWKRQLRKIGEAVDERTAAVFEEDIDWLNQILQTKLQMGEFFLERDKYFLRPNPSVRNYGKVKKYMPLGIGGSAVFGFCLLDIIGAAACFAGTSMIYGIISYKDISQNDEICAQIHGDIERISRDVRRLALSEVERIYEETLSEFKKEKDRIISLKYPEVGITDDELSKRLTRVEKIILQMEE